MSKVVIVGGGWSGCAAALTARQAGASEVIVLERTDTVLGTGLVGGIMRNNGRYTAAEEMIALGAGTLFELCDRTSTHRNMEFPGHKHASLYDVGQIEMAVRNCLKEHEIEVRYLNRVSGVAMNGESIAAVTMEKKTIKVEGDAFIDSTGSFGPQAFCTKYGNGCVMCIMRCPTFGRRESVTGLVGIEEKQGRKPDGTIGAMSGACEIAKECLTPALLKELEEKGVLVLPIPDHLVKPEKLAAKACQQYALPEYASNVILLDNGRAKLMASHIPYDQLRLIPGLENMRYSDPYSGTLGNSMRYAALAPRDDAMQVQGPVNNLFCGGEKAGLLVGHTEAIVTGSLAGHNAVRKIAGMETLKLPGSLAVGDAITHVRERMQTDEGMCEKYTFSGAGYFKRMKELGLYTTDTAVVEARVAAAGLTGVFKHPIIANPAKLDARDLATAES
jgi:hypothetical protein